MSRTDNTFGRDLRILQRHVNGETLAAIAADFGITRERARQIVAGFAAKPKRAMVRDRNAEVLAAAKRENLTATEAAERFSISVATVYQIGRRAGHAFRRDLLRETERIAALAEQVRAGASIIGLAAGDSSTRGLLLEYCKRHGIKSLHGPHRDFEPRRAAIIAMRAEGCSWRDIADEVAVIEGIRVSTAAIYNWAYKYIGGMAMKAPRTKRPPQPRPRKSRPHYSVVLCDNAKAAALANYGQAPASVVAKAHGVTRNSIIGHWFRLRQSGLIKDVNTAHKNHEVA